MNHLGLLLLASFLALSATSTAEAADGYYKGKTVTAYVGYNAGGTNDIVTRLVAAHIGRHLDGAPTVIVKNMPGAGSRTLAGYLFHRAAKDGTELGNIDRALTTESLLDPNVKNPFEVLRFTWLGSPMQETLLCVAWHTSPIKSLQDMQSREMVIASPGSTSGESILAQVFNTLIGTQIRTVSGYPGGNEMNLAMQRGEVDGRCGLGWGAIKANYQNWIRDKEMTVLIQAATSRHPDLPNVPAASELAKTEDDRKALEVIFANQTLGRPFIGPPNMPEDRKQAVRRAFDATMKDPQFVTEAERLKIELQPLTGEEMEQVLKSAYATPAPVLARVAAIVKAP